VNPDTIGYAWTGEYDLNTLRVDGEIFESGTKKLRSRKYPDTCGQGPSGPCLIFSLYFRKTDFKKQNVVGTLIQKAEMTKMK